MIRQLRSFPNQLTLLRLVFIPFIVINVVGQNYGWALGLFIAAGLSDFLDGNLARLLKQRTLLGEYLDPIADKMLLSTMFLVLSIMHKIPWKYTVLVFSRDVSILVTSAVLYITGALRDFRPSVLGKANTCAEISAVFFVLVHEVTSAPWVEIARRISLWTTLVLTIASGIHYVILAGQRMRASHTTGASA